VKFKKFFFLYLVPVLIVLLSLTATIPVYNQSKRPVTNVSYPFHPTTPPQGLASINLTFSKTDLKAWLYSLTFNLEAKTNQTAYVLVAFYQEQFGEYSIDQISMQPDERASGKFATEKFQASYLGWSLKWIRTAPLETFTPQDFPVDVYETPRIIMSFNNSFILGDFWLCSEIPTGFVASLIDFRILSGNELPLQFVGDPWFAKSLTLSFKVAMVREQNAIGSLLMYILAPSLCIYWVAAIAQLKGKDSMDRLKIYVGAMFALFSYIFTLRNLTPTSPTNAELLLISGIIVWGFIESARVYFET